MALGLAAVTVIAPVAVATTIYAAPVLVPVAYMYAPYYGEVVNFVSGLIKQTGPPQGWGYISGGALYISRKIQNYLTAESPAACGKR